MTEETTTAKPLSVFVTGAETSIGRALVRALVRRGCRVTGAVRSGTAGAVLVRADGGVPVFPSLVRAGEIRSVLKMARADVVVHLASQALNVLPFTPVDWTGHRDVLNGEALLEAAKSVGVKRVIYTSFAFLYGDTEGATADEDTPTSPVNDFYKAAIKAEKAILKAQLPAYVLRLGYLYGGHNPALDALANMLRTGKILPQGKGFASFVQLEDAVEALIALITRADEPASRVYNIVDDAPTTLDGFVDALANGLGVGQPLRVPALLQTFTLSETQNTLLAQSFRASNARAKAELGWQPTYATLAAGIERMLMQWRAEGASTDQPAREEKALTLA